MGEQFLMSEVPLYEVGSYDRSDLTQCIDELVSESQLSHQTIDLTF